MVHIQTPSRSSMIIVVSVIADACSIIKMIIGTSDDFGTEVPRAGEREREKKGGKIQGFVESLSQ